MSLFRHTYRIESARHPHWDYARAGWYYVTINTRQRRHFFGEVLPLIDDSGHLDTGHETMMGREITPGAIYSPGDPVPRAFRGHKNHIVLSGIGRIVADEWLKTPKIRPNVDLDEWVIMPDHIHGIIVIKRSVETPRRGISTDGVRGNQSLNRSRTPIKNWKPGSLGVIINQFKGQCTKRIGRELEPAFGWQTRFHDRIIRDRDELEHKRRYIHANPDEWEHSGDNEQMVM